MHVYPATGRAISKSVGGAVQLVEEISQSHSLESGTKDRVYRGTPAICAYRAFTNIRWPPDLRNADAFMRTRVNHEEGKFGKNDLRVSLLELQTHLSEFSAGWKLNAEASAVLQHELSLEQDIVKWLERMNANLDPTRNPDKPVIDAVRQDARERRPVAPAYTESRTRAASRAPDPAPVDSICALDSQVKDKASTYRLSENLVRSLRYDFDMATVEAAMRNVDWHSSPSGDEIRRILHSVKPTPIGYSVGEALEHVKEFVSSWQLSDRVDQALKWNLPFGVNIINFLQRTNVSLGNDKLRKEDRDHMVLSKIQDESRSRKEALLDDGRSRRRESHAREEMRPPARRSPPRRSRSPPRRRSVTRRSRAPRDDERAYPVSERKFSPVRNVQPYSKAVPQEKAAPQRDPYERTPGVKAVPQEKAAPRQPYHETRTLSPKAPPPRDHPSSSSSSHPRSIASIDEEFRAFAHEYRLDHQAIQALSSVPIKDALDIVREVRTQRGLKNPSAVVTAHTTSVQGGPGETLGELLEHVKEFIAGWKLDAKAEKCLWEDLPVSVKILKWLRSINEELGKANGNPSMICVQRVRETVEDEKDRSRRSTRRESMRREPPKTADELQRELDDLHEKLRKVEKQKRAAKLNLRMGQQQMPSVERRHERDDRRAEYDDRRPEYDDRREERRVAR